MLLCVDVGNTQTHFGLFGDSGLADHWRFATRRSATADELALKIGGMLDLRGYALAEVGALVVSSVVPQLGPEYERLGERELGRPCLLVGPGVRTGMPIRMDDPREVGADRLVNAIAAYERVRGACVVADFGTAITFDAISEDGEYLGGIIAPGVEISMEALTERAAKLPKVDLHAPDTVIGKTTRASIQAGIVYGFAGAIDGIAGRLREELGPGVSFIATGGLAESIIPHCVTAMEVDDLLTLTGLRLIWERNL